MDESINTFLRSIEEQSQAEIDAIRREVAADHEEKEERIRARAQSEAASRLEAEMSGIAQRERLASDARLSENRAALLKERAACADEARQALLERVEAFCASKEYPAHLAALVSRAETALGAAGQRLAVTVRPADMAHADALRKRPGGGAVDVREGNIRLGGVIVEAPALGRRADLSFDTGVEAAMARFAETFGLEI